MPSDSRSIPRIVSEFVEESFSYMSEPEITEIEESEEESYPAEFTEETSADRGRTQSSGNMHERLECSSGEIVVIDQFMLANRQFLHKLERVRPSQSEQDEVLRSYGGVSLTLSKGTYPVVRDSQSKTILISMAFADKNFNEVSSQISEYCSLIRERSDLGEGESISVDTGCVVLMDRELLLHESLLIEYRALWETADFNLFIERQKKARDMLREKGAAVRYGFGRHSHELRAYKVADAEIAIIGERGRQ